MICAMLKTGGTNYAGLESGSVKNLLAAWQSRFDRPSILLNNKEGLHGKII